MLGIPFSMRTTLFCVFEFIIPQNRALSISAMPKRQNYMQKRRNTCLRSDAFRNRIYCAFARA